MIFICSYYNLFKLRQNIDISDKLIENLLRNNNNKSNGLLPSILNENDKKTFLVFDNVNLILRNFNNNPFKIISFIVESNKRSSKKYYLLKYIYVFAY